MIFFSNYKISFTSLWFCCCYYYCCDCQVVVVDVVIVDVDVVFIIIFLSIFLFSCLNEILLCVVDCMFRWICFAVLFCSILFHFFFLRNKLYIMQICKRVILFYCNFYWGWIFYSLRFFPEVMGIIILAKLSII